MSSASKAGKVFTDSTVDIGKVEYLLDLDQNSIDGRGKAKFFTSLGFSSDNPNWFAEAIRTHYKTASLKKEQNTVWGRKFIFTCNMATPSGKSVCIVSVWQIDTGQTLPRLVTAYPEEK